ncbi:hypothetical protein [Noviherbaspirillum aerium]|uniref:hypothetical protein n=1 Tax=Noviherbaspirillum aerium TaxID=2588497 RepID=UPI00124F6B3F|nr:hypothetical protein [Noviherbaspirillum aerium]
MPVIRDDPTFRKIKEPENRELHPEIEKFRNDSMKNSGNEINWMNYLLEGQDEEAKKCILELKRDLALIDDKVNRSIEELRLTAYEDIRSAKKAPSSNDEQAARSKTKRTMKERLSIGASRSELKAQRLSERQKLLRDSEGSRANEEALVAAQALGRFKQRVTMEFEPARRKDMRDVCVKQLAKHFGERLPTGPLYQLVSEFSPEAAEEFIVKYSKLKEYPPLFKSFVAGIKSDDIRGLMGRTSLEELQKATSLAKPVHVERHTSSPSASSERQGKNDA